LIDATGRGGVLASSMGARRRRDDSLLAFVARLRPAEGAPVDCDARTLIEAAPDGWWYSARLPRGERLVAFHTDPDLVDPVALRSGDGFLERLHAAPHLKALLTAHKYRLTARPWGVDAGSARLEPVAMGAAPERWLAVGDAAISLDPLSSQGLMTAAYTWLRGAEAILAALDGEPSVIERYWGRLRSIYAAYLEHRTQYYALETRWSHREFWRRRVRRSIAARKAMEPLFGSSAAAE
jgi:flavin-dependent dehydrogenase